jgi:uncharacterized membrane protein (DUF485 family)
MAGLDFKEPLTKEEEEESIVEYNTRLGVGLFFVYLIFYAGFMGLSAFWPQVMSHPSIGGVNIAILYGFTLIAAALLLAVIYLIVCKKPGQSN